MKTLLAASAIAFASAWLPAHAQSRSGFVLETESPQQIDVYNDGRNTYIQAAPGLVVKGATHDGDRYIIKGTPREIQALMAGRPITLTQESGGRRPGAARSSEADLVNRIEQLQKREAALAAKTGAAPRAPAQSECPFVIRREDGKLSDILDSWAKRAGYQLSWEIKGEEPVISMTASYCDKDFLAALEEVLASYEDSNPMQAIVWRRNNAIQIVTGSR